MEELLDASQGILITRVFYTVANLDPNAVYGWQIMQLGDLQLFGYNEANALISQWPSFTPITTDGLATGFFQLSGTISILGRSILIQNLSNNASVSRCVVGMAEVCVFFVPQSKHGLTRAENAI